MPDALNTICKPYLNVAAANTDLETMAFVVKLRVICSNTLPWETDCQRLMSIDTSSPEARLADGNLTLMQVVEEDTWYKNLSCNILQEAALQGVRMGLIKRRGGIWKPIDTRNVNHTE